MTSHDSEPNTNTAAKSSTQRNESERALRTLTVILGCGILGTIVFALQASTKREFVSFAANGVLISAASATFGGLLGFLFGIPRTLQQEGSALSIVARESDAGNEKSMPETNYRANTNLEQISDWLTKILVGVGLTQLTVIPGKLVTIANAIASDFGSVSGSRTYALTVILFFLICGFLFSYLWTRLYLPGAFRQADLGVLALRVERAASEVKQVNQKLRDIERQAELDAIALSLVQRQLNNTPDAPPVSEDQLKAALKAASRPMKVQIFTLAQNQRASTWRNDKEQMELTIPVFEGLIVADSEGKFHRNHAQLGYALKDQRRPAWPMALDELNKAIEIRGPWQSSGWLFYEFNRAVCNINLDADYMAGRASSNEAKKIILADLKAAAHAKLKKALMSDPNVSAWLSLNGLTSKDLPD
ncbi:MAG TPA: hypothetical protein VLB46_01885 [Pyrinomonadaceae bacterium]|nr:hypothetical protein [Pyrinomonadaceae bacterium]